MNQPTTVTALRKQQGSSLQQQGNDSIFGTMAAFENAQRVAKMLSSSDMVPKQYQGNLPNCIIALEMANRIGASVFAVMQNMHVIHGKPGWSAQFAIATVNTCGRFHPLRYDLQGQGDKRGCTAWTMDKHHDWPADVHTLSQARAAELPVLESTPVTIELAKAEGWYQKSGSKWQTMPDQMLTYRSASFWSRAYCPELLMGMQTTDELHDVYDTSVDGAGVHHVNVPVDVSDMTVDPETQPEEEPESGQIAGDKRPDSQKAESASADDGDEESQSESLELE